MTFEKKLVSGESSIVASRANGETVRCKALSSYQLLQTGVVQLFDLLRLVVVQPPALRLHGVDRVLGNFPFLTTSSTFRPASTSFSAAMIRASL